MGVFLFILPSWLKTSTLYELYVFPSLPATPSHCPITYEQEQEQQTRQTRRRTRLIFFGIKLTSTAPSTTNSGNFCLQSKPLLPCRKHGSKVKQLFVSTTTKRMT